MAKIEVNHQTLRAMAAAIEEYCDTQDREMAKVDESVKNMLRADWIGPDALEFGGSWEGVDAKDSVAIKFRDSLQAYADALRSCANAYQDAQESVYNLASLLPR